MKRRKFLQLLGFAPTIPAIAAVADVDVPPAVDVREQNFQTAIAPTSAFVWWADCCTTTALARVDYE